MAEAMGDAIQDEVDKVIVHCLDLDVDSIDIVQALLYSTCVTEITDLVESPLRLAVVPIVCSNSVLHLFPVSVPISIYFPLFHIFSICT